MVMERKGTVGRRKREGERAARRLLDAVLRASAMGEIRAKVKLENEGDVLLRKAGRRRKVRSLELDAVVDTGAVMMLLPREMAQALGLEERGKVIVLLADDRKVEMARAGGILLTVAGRQMTADCLVGPPGCEPLLGQIVLESLDLIPDPVKRTLTPRPESPFLPTLKLKSFLRRESTHAHPLPGIRFA